MSRQPVPAFNYLHSKKALLSILPVFSAYAHCLWPFHGIPLRRVYLHPLYFPLSLCQINSSLSLSLSFYVRCCSLIIIVALYWAPSSMSISCTGEPSTGHSTPDVASPGLSSAEGSPPSTCWQCFSGLRTSLWWMSGGSCLPFLQPVEIPLNGSTTFWCISHSSQPSIAYRASSRAKQTQCGLEQEQKFISTYLPSGPWLYGLCSPKAAEATRTLSSPSACPSEARQGRCAERPFVLLALHHATLGHENKSITRQNEGEITAAYYRSAAALRYK